MNESDAFAKITLNGDQITCGKALLLKLDYFSKRYSPAWTISREDDAVILDIEGVTVEDFRFMTSKLGTGAFPPGEELSRVFGTIRLCKFLSAMDLCAELVTYFKTAMSGAPLKSIVQSSEQKEFEEIAKCAEEELKFYLAMLSQKILWSKRSHCAM
eukprot:510413_1